MLRPEPMVWVDLVVRTSSVNTILEAVARTGLFEAERSGQSEFDRWDETCDSASKALELRARLRPFTPFLPPADVNATTRQERQSSFDNLSDDIHERIESWIRHTRDDIHHLSELQAEHDQLGDLELALEMVPEQMLLEYWQNQKSLDRIAWPVVAIGTREDVQNFLASTATPYLHAHVAEERTDAVITGVVAASDMATLRSQMSQHRLRELAVPEWVSGVPRQAMGQVQEHRGRTGDRINQYLARIGSQNKSCRMDAMLWLIERQNWIDDKMEKVHQGKNFVHLGGWVPRERYGQLTEALDATDCPYLVRLDKRPADLTPPSMLNNPGWVKQFELFVTGFGTPGTDEVDPSLVIALMTPLMFGYMFGDVGQGFLLLLAGLWLRRRISWAGLLVPAGISSMLFGLLYGSIFSVEGILPALWLHPMEYPLVILALPLLLGLVVMLLSLAFGFVESRWRGQSRGWVNDDLPTLLCYLATPLFFVSIELALVLATAGVLVLLFNPEHQGRTLGFRFGMLLPALLLLLERWMQLLVNTLSFARLGAFALAHSGLSVALMSLVSLSDSWLIAGLILVIGNLFITGLEGLVVSVQTTRLVMFEFFRRFFQGSGRSFQPMTMKGHPGNGGNAN